MAETNNHTHTHACTHTFTYVAARPLARGDIRVVINMRLGVRIHVLLVVPTARIDEVGVHTVLVAEAAGVEDVCIIIHLHLGGDLKVFLLLGLGAVVGAAEVDHHCMHAWVRYEMCVVVLLCVLFGEGDLIWLGGGMGG